MKEQKLTEAENIAKIITGKEVDAKFAKSDEVQTRKVLEGEQDEFIVNENNTESIADVFEQERADYFQALAVEEMGWLRSVYGEAFRHIQKESTGEGYSKKAKESLETIYRGQRENFLGDGRQDFSSKEQEKKYSEATENIRSPAELIENLQGLALQTGTADLKESKQVAEDVAVAHAKIESALERLEEEGLPRIDLYKEERSMMELYRKYMPQPV